MTLLALLPAYCSIEGLVTGETRAIARHTHLHAGVAGIVTAIAYGLFATALVIAAVGYLSGRTALFKWAWHVTIVGAVLFFSGRIAWMVQ